MTFVKTNQQTQNNSMKFFIKSMGQENRYIHGWPLNHEMWEYQLNELSKLRCIAYDRRGW
jgi:hypothetical protein